MFKIMIVEDDLNIRKLMKKVLSTAGYDTIEAANGLEALDLLDSAHVDLIVLDVMMPEMDGFAFTAELRAANILTPILMVTAKETFPDKKKGFSLGADDYMVKPVNEEEMLLRIGALLRRSRIASEQRLTIGETELIFDEMVVVQNGERITPPNKEFLLLFKFLSSPNKIFTRRQLMDEIWSMDSDSTERTVDVHMRRLRERFAENKDFELVTVRGLGYKAVII